MRIRMWILVAAAVVVAYYLLMLRAYGSFGNPGIFGDTAGFLTAIFGAASFLLLIYTVHLQREELQLTRKALEISREELERTNSLIEQQKKEMEANQRIQKDILFCDLLSSSMKMINDSISAKEDWLATNKEFYERYTQGEKTKMESDPSKYSISYKNLVREIKPVEWVDDFVEKYEGKERELRKYSEYRQLSKDFIDKAMFLLSEDMKNWRKT